MYWITTSTEGQVIIHEYYNDETMNYKAVHPKSKLGQSLLRVTYRQTGRKEIKYSERKLN